MKPSILLTTVVCTAVVLFSSLWIASCSSATKPDYDFQPSAHIEPDSAYTTSANHVLNLRLSIQTPSRSCWELDKALHGSDSDFVYKKRFTYVVASIRKLSSSVCPSGLDTLRANLSIPFDSAGVYEVRFPQVSPRGLLIEKSVLYTVP